jgi:type VI secretion system secreted protein Hcp
MAKTNVYLKLEGIDGESEDEDHDKWIELESWNWSVSNPATFAATQGGHATQATFSDMHIMKVVDLASNNLWRFCTTGKHIPSATVSFMKLDGETRVEYHKIHITDLLITSVGESATGSDIMQESVTLTCAEFKRTYKGQQDTGSAGGGLDFGYHIQKSKAS